MLLILLLSSVSSLISQPAPITFTSFNTITQLLSFSYPSYSADSSYVIKYLNSSKTFFLPTRTSTQASIFCPQVDGTVLTISYQITTPSDSSLFSSPVSLYCASVPGPISQLSYTNNLNIITITWSAPAKNGLPIIGYRVKRYEKTWNVQGTTTELSFNDNISYNVAYTYSVFGYNQVGEASSGYSLPINIAQQATAENSTVIKPATLLTGYLANSTVILKDSGGNSVLNPCVLVLEIRDVCSITNGYECIRVNSSDPNYVPDLLIGFNYSLMVNNNNGSMTGNFTPDLQGPYTFSVIQLQPAGVLVNFWDNIWCMPPVDSVAVMPNFNFSYPSGALITTYSSEYVSLKLFSFLLITVPANYTFYVTADDFFSFYINGAQIFSSLEICCIEFSFNYFFYSAGYYFIQIEYIQLDSSASLTVQWSSSYFSRSAIPESLLFWPKRVSGSPWIQSAAIGLSSVSNSYFTGPSQMTAGEIYKYQFFSVNKLSQPLNNPDDVFEVTLTGPASYYFVSNYSGANMAYVQAGLAGTYTVNVLLYGSDIQGSPYSLNVVNGYPSVLYSYTDVVSSVRAGVPAVINVHLFDFFKNPTAGGQITMQVNWIDSNDYSSALNLAAVDQSGFGFNHSGDFNKNTLTFSVFIAGNYVAFVYLDRFLITKFNFKALPADVYAPNCVGFFNQSSVIAGNSFSFYVQTRDFYFNNELIENIPDYYLIAHGPADIQGQIEVTAGVITAILTPNIAGTYSIILKISDVLVPISYNFSVFSSVFSYGSSSLSVSSSAVAGSSVFISVITMDDYGNMLSGGLSLDYSIANSKSNVTGSLADFLNGTYLITFVPLLVDTYDISVSYNGQLIDSSSVIVVNSNIKGSTSTLSSFTSVIAGKGQLSIISKDIGRNVITNPVNSSYIGDMYYYINIYGPQSLNVKAISNDLSVYKLVLSQLTVAGNYLLTLALMEENGLNGFYYQDNSFQGLYKNINYRNIPNLFPQFLTSKDPVLNFSFKSTPFSDFFSAMWQGQILPPLSDLYTFTIKSDNKAALLLNSVSVLDSITGSSNSGSIQLTGGVFYNISVSYLHGGNNGFLSLYWSSSSFSQTIVPSSVLFSEVLSDSGPVSLTVTPDSTVARMCYISNTSDPDPVNRAYVRVTKTITAYSRDQYGNSAVGTNDVFIGVLSTSTSSVSFTFTNSGPGVYKGSFTANSPGTYTLKVSLLINNVQNLVNQTYINVLSGPTNASKTSIIDVPVSVTAGSESSFIVVARDSSGSQQIKGGDNLGVSLVSGSYTVPNTQVLVTDNNDGTYTVYFMSYLSGSFVAVVNMNGLFAGNVSISIVSASLSIPNSVILLPQQKNTFGSTLICYVYLKDIYSNPYSQVMPVFVYASKETNPNFLPLKFAVNAQDLSKGFYNATAIYNLQNVDRSGQCTSSNVSSLCNFTGVLTIRSGVFAPKLLAKYYSNPSLSGTESFSQLESNISASWTDSAFNINLNSFSAKWQGFILPSQSQIYTFYLPAKDSASLYIDGQLLLTSSSTSASLSMASSSYYILLVSLTNSKNTSSIALQWQDNTVQLVPGSVLFSYLSGMYISDSPVSFLTVYPDGTVAK